MTDATSPESSTAPNGKRCRHFGDCGGCQSQDLPYAAQVEAKSAMLAELFAAFSAEPVPVTPSPRIWHYRNKVDPSFSPMQYEKPPPEDFQRETVLGYKRTGRWFWPLDIEECLIGPEGMDMLLPAVRNWYRAEGHRAFDSRKDEGILRNLLVRDAKRTGERMVVLITCPGELDLSGFVEAVQTAFPAHSIYRGISSRKAEVAIADELELLYGAEQITETLEIPLAQGLRTLHFRISPNSFFQTNPLATEALYGALRQRLTEIQPECLYDLYGGSGGIAFTCADLVSQVWSVESVAEASLDGEANARRNDIHNVTFITEDVRHYLRHQREAEGLASGAAVIVDPPRSGMHPKALKRLVALGPEHILYVSCNPKILAKELPTFLGDYALHSLEGFDLFPHTRHVEVLAHLRRK